MNARVPGHLAPWGTVKCCGRDNDTLDPSYSKPSSAEESPIIFCLALQEPSMKELSVAPCRPAGSPSAISRARFRTQLAETLHPLALLASI
jgi:hypothetical protein